MVERSSRENACHLLSFVPPSAHPCFLPQHYNQLGDHVNIFPVLTLEDISPEAMLDLVRMPPLRFLCHDLEQFLNRVIGGMNESCSPEELSHP